MPLSRTHLTVAQLETEPAKDLPTVHAILQSGIRDVEQQLQQLELSYYGPGRSSVDDVTASASAVKPMLTVARVRAFLSAEQISSATRLRDVDLDSLSLSHIVPNSTTPGRQQQRVAAQDRTTVAPAVKLPSDNEATKHESVNKSDCDVPAPDSSATTKTSKTSSNKNEAPCDKQQATNEPVGNNDVCQTTSSAAAASPVVGSSDDDVLFNLSRTLRNCLRKVLDFVPDRFDDVIADTRRLQRFLRKYCISFYDTVDDSLKADASNGLETAASYDAQIGRRLSAVDDALADIRILSDLFRKSELRIADFGHFGVDLSRRTGCAHAPFLMLFPASCERVRFAVDEMRAWVADDAAYADFISNDVADLECRVKVAERRVIALRALYHQSAFRTRQSEATCEQLNADIKKTQARQDQLIVNEEILAAETDELRTEGETTEYRLNELTRNAALYRPEDHYEKFNELSERLREIRQRLPVAEQSLESVRQKLAQLAEKKHRFESECKSLSEMKTERDRVLTRLSEQEVERDVYSVRLAAARRILLCKRSPDAVSKIFYDRPVHLSNVSRLPGAHGTNNENELFDATCKVVASRINSDWQALYRALPFYPPRGVSTIDHDIAEMSESREPAVAAAGRALGRWRRFHTRACVDDLKTTLHQIGRADVLRRVAARTRRRKNATASLAPTQVPDWLEPQLVPYWHEVERYDHLRASRV